jgi:hypothetical protein
MSSQKQIEANRRNAQKSTGPKTPEGRATVSRNSIKHGLTASTLVLPDESEADFEALLDSVEAEHQPATPTEVALVRRIAMAIWRLIRGYHIEAGLYAVRRIDLDDTIEKYKGLDPCDRLAIIVRDDALGPRALTNLSCYEIRLERSMDKALRELQRLRSARCIEMEKQSQSTQRQPDPEPAPHQTSSTPEMPAQPINGVPPLQCRLTIVHHKGVTSWRQERGRCLRGMEPARKPVTSGSPGEFD